MRCEVIGRKFESHDLLPHLAFCIIVWREAKPAGTRSICTDVRSSESLTDPKVSRGKRLILDEKRVADWAVEGAATSNALICGS